MLTAVSGGQPLLTRRTARFSRRTDDRRVRSGHDADMTATARQGVLSRLVPAACGLNAEALLVAGRGSPPDRNEKLVAAHEWVGRQADMLGLLDA